MDRLFTVTQAAELLGTTDRFPRRLIAERGFSFVAVEGDWVVCRFWDRRKLSRSSGGVRAPGGDAWSIMPTTGLCRLG